MRGVPHDLALYNGRFVSSRDPLLPLGQAGLFTGWGVFTTLRIYAGIPFAFERHWERLTRDAGLLAVEMPKDRDALRDRLIELARRNRCPEAKMRLNIVRADPGIWESVRTGRASNVAAFSADLVPGPDTAALCVRAQGRHAGSRFAGTKTLSWVHNLALFRAAQDSGYADALLLNEFDHVSECTSANVFIVRDGVTVTPPLSSGALPGITREVMLGELGEPVEEATLRESDLYAADEVFITSSTRELLPVDRIGDRPLPGPWPVMERLRGKLQEYVAGYVRSARR